MCNAENKALSRYNREYGMMELNIPKKFRDDINTAVEILRGEGCQAIYLFGSLKLYIIKG